MSDFPLTLDMVNREAIKLLHTSRWACRQRKIMLKRHRRRSELHQLDEHVWDWRSQPGNLLQAIGREFDEAFAAAGRKLPSIKASAAPWRPEGLRGC